MPNIAITAEKATILCDISARETVKWTVDFSMNPILWLFLKFLNSSDKTALPL